MRALLDTHSFIWFVEGDARLSPNARQIITDPTNEVLFSAASLWEIAIKVSIGKLALTLPFTASTLGHMAHNDIRLLDIGFAHIQEVLTLPFHHRDPFDRMIVAQARVENIPIIGVDEMLDSYGVQRIW
jgi:PIN domain nuclease of toxin-antitoxin system